MKNKTQKAIDLISKPVRNHKNALIQQVKELRNAIALDYILSEEDRKKRLTEVAMLPVKQPVTGREVVLSITELNKMEHVYEEQTPPNVNIAFVIGRGYRELKQLQDVGGDDG